MHGGGCRVSFSRGGSPKLYPPVVTNPDQCLTQLTTNLTTIAFGFDMKMTLHHHHPPPALSTQQIN